MKRSARMAAFLLAAALSAAPCMAEFTPVEVPQATNAPAAPKAMENVPQITEKGLTLGNNSVKYPEITGMADESIQQQVNDAILQAGKIENQLSRMAVLMSSPVPLTVTYSAALSGDVLSVAILSSGALETERATQNGQRSISTCARGRKSPLTTCSPTRTKRARKWRRPSRMRFCRT